MFGAAPQRLGEVLVSQRDEDSLTPTPETEVPCLLGMFLPDTLRSKDLNGRQRSPSSSSTMLEHSSRLGGNTSTSTDGRFKKLVKWQFPSDSRESSQATGSGTTKQSLVPRLSLESANRQAISGQAVQPTATFSLYTSDYAGGRQNSVSRTTSVDDRAARSTTSVDEPPMLIGRRFSLRIVTAEEETVAETMGLLDLQAVDKDRSDSDVSFELDGPLLSSIAEELSESTVSHVMSVQDGETPKTPPLEASHSDFLRLLQARKSQASKPLILVTSPTTFTARVKQRFAEKREQWRLAAEKKKLEQEDHDAAPQPSAYLAHLSESEHVLLQCKLTEFLLKYVVHDPL